MNKKICLLLILLLSSSTFIQPAQGQLNPNVALRQGLNLIQQENYDQVVTLISQLREQGATRQAQELQSALDKARAAEGAVVRRRPLADDQMAELDRLNRDRANLQRRIDELNAQTRLTQNQIDELRRLRDEDRRLAQQQLDEAKKAQKKLEDELTQLRTLSAAEKQTLLANLDEAKKVRDQLEKQVKDCQDSLIKSAGVIQKQMGELKECRENLEKATGQINTLQDQVKELQKQLQAGGADKAEIDRLIQKIKDLEQGSKDLQAAVEQLTQSLATEQQKSKDLLADLDRQKEIIKQRDGVIATLERVIEELKKKGAGTGDSDALKVCQQELIAARETITSLNQQIKEGPQKALAECGEKLAEELGKSKGLQDSLTRATTTISQLQQDLKSAQAEVKSLQDQIIQLKTGAGADVQKLLEDCNKDKIRLQQEKQEVRDTLTKQLEETVNSKNKECEDRIANIKASLKTRILQYVTAKNLTGEQTKAINDYIDYITAEKTFFPTVIPGIK